MKFKGKQSCKLLLITQPFPPGKVGYGVPLMEDLSNCEVDLWDGDSRPDLSLVEG